MSYKVEFSPEAVDDLRHLDKALALGEEEKIASIEQRIDELAAEKWGLTKEELKEIQESLAELKS